MMVLSIREAAIASTFALPFLSPDIQAGDDPMFEVTPRNTVDLSVAIGARRKAPVVTNILNTLLSLGFPVPSGPVPCPPDPCPCPPDPCPPYHPDPCPPHHEKPAVGFDDLTGKKAAVFGSGFGAVPYSFEPRVVPEQDVPEEFKARVGFDDLIGKAVVFGSGFGAVPYSFEPRVVPEQDVPEEFKARVGFDDLIGKAVVFGSGFGAVPYSFGKPRVVPEQDVPERRELEDLHESLVPLLNGSSDFLEILIELEDDLE